MTLRFGRQTLRWLAIALIASVANARAEAPDAPIELTVWQQGFIGRIGETPVQLPYLQRIGDRIEGVYCHGACTSQTDGLRLAGTWRDGGLSLDESTPDASGQQQITGHWRLQQDGNAWRGEWRSADGTQRLAASIAAYDDATDPFELRVMAAFAPGTDADGCDAQSPPVSAIRVYRDGTLLQTLGTDAVGTCGMFLPRQFDMNFDGYPDITIALTLPASPNIPHQSWLYDPATQRFVDAPASLQDITSPEFDPKHRIVYSFWRGSCCSHGVDTYRWKDGDLEALDSEASHLLPVLRQGKLGYLYSMPGYVDGKIVFSPRIVRDAAGKLQLEGIDDATFELEDEPFAWSESLAVDVFAIDAEGASRRVRSDAMRWKRIKDAAGLRWCPNLAVYDVDRHRIVRRLVDSPESCPDTAPGQ
ncbi:MAG: hypothetical protein ABL934_13465 [Lysobacteraceae bacterium]